MPPLLLVRHHSLVIKVLIVFSSVALLGCNALPPVSVKIALLHLLESSRVVKRSAMPICVLQKISMLLAGSFMSVCLSMSFPPRCKSRIAEQMLVDTMDAVTEAHHAFVRRPAGDHALTLYWTIDCAQHQLNARSFSKPERLPLAITCLLKQA